ncbi:MAG TPA: Na/Pi cotransporter family protein, partial [Acidimicrobiia bacterium]|nr:Na/Pi cotransporter family protein [Acidimicrobiia bacterium]
MNTAPDWFFLIMGFFGGLSLFLLGMDRTISGFKGIAGNRLRWILSHLTGNRLYGVITGATITAMIQSSSVSTVVIVGLISANAMTLAQAIPVIFGANIGSTVTAQIIAFQVTKYALAVVTIGYAIEFFARRELLGRIGRTIMGLGLVFFGLSVMGISMVPLQTYQPFIDAMAAISNVWVGIAIGAAFTAVIQSSAATMAIVISLALQGLIGLELAIAIVLGANIGTSVTAQLAAIGKPPDARRAAFVHTTFNVLGALIWVPFIGVLAAVAIRLSPPGDIARQIAWSSTVFNVANVLIFIWFTKWFARAAVLVIKGKPEDEVHTIVPRYLSPELLATPSFALDSARREIARMGSHVRDMVVEGIEAAISGTATELAAIAAADKDIDELHAGVVTYLARISEGEITRKQTDELLGLLEASGDIEAIGDAVSKNLVSDGLKRLESSLVISLPTRAIITDLADEVIAAVDIATAALATDSPEAAQRAIDMKPEIAARTAEARGHQLERLTADEPQRFEAFRIETDIIARGNLPMKSTVVAVALALALVATACGGSSDDSADSSGSSDVAAGRLSRQPPQQSVDPLD